MGGADVTETGMKEGVTEDRVAVSIRLSSESHRAAMVAAARANKSLNQWLADLAQAASGASNAAALLLEMRSLDIVQDERAVVVVIERAVELVRSTLDLAGNQLSEIHDVLEKIGSEIESMAGAQELRAKRTGGGT